MLQEPFRLCQGSSTRSLQQESSLSHWANTWAWTHCRKSLLLKKDSQTDATPGCVCLCSPCWISTHPCLRSKEQFLLLLETTILLVLTSEEKLFSVFLLLVCVWLQFSFLLEPFSCPSASTTPIQSSYGLESLESANAWLSCASAATVLFALMGSSWELTSGAGRTTKESEHLYNAHLNFLYRGCSLSLSYSLHLTSHMFCD